MSEAIDQDAVESSAIDGLVHRLRARRVAAGAPSYAEIAAGVAQHRIARGCSEFEARIARSTVYDLFRPGRRRLDLDLLIEVVGVLGADAEETEQWRAEWTEAMAAPPIAGPALELPELGQGATTIRPLAGYAAVVLMLAGWLLNMSGVLLNGALPLNLYLDMIGTAIVAIVLGPWHGVLVGLTTNVGEAFHSGTADALWFGLANAAGALVWGYGVRRGLGRTIPRFALLNVLAALAVSAVASVVLVNVYGGHTGQGADRLIEHVMDSGHSLWVSVVSTNIVNSLCDKMLAGFLALFVAEWIISRQRGRATALPWSDLTED